jgi:hypothetical protein
MLSVQNDFLLQHELNLLYIKLSDKFIQFKYRPIFATLPRQWYLLFRIIIIMTLQPFVGPWPLFQFLDPIHSRNDSLDGGPVCRKAATYT